MRFYIGDDEEHETHVKFTMAVQITEEQFQKLMALLSGKSSGGGEAGHAAGAASVVRPMQHCLLGKDKIRGYKRWVDWIQDAENKMKVLQITTDQAKIGFIRSCAGAELTEFRTKEAGIRFKAVAAEIGDSKKLIKGKVCRAQEASGYIVSQG